MTHQTVPLSALQPSSANPRTVIDTDTLEGLAASIKSDGLLQNLVVQPAAGKGKAKRYRVVSGERRFRALNLLAERGEIATDFDVPVDVRAKLSKHDTLRLATIENLQRQNLPPLDEATALASLIRKGTSLDDLAARTGLSPTTIRRRLVLNDLCDEAKTALVNATITLSQAESLTLGTHEAQCAILSEIERGYGDFSLEDIRHHLIDDRPAVALAIFPVEQYTGTITTDLFAEDQTSYFDDVEQFFTLQREAVEKLASDHQGKSAWVEVTNNYRIPDWLYRKADDGQESGVLINLSPSGQVEIRDGLIKPDSDDDTIRAVSDNPAMPKKPKASYASPLCRYIAWHKSLAVQQELLANPRTAREVSAVLGLLALKPHDGIHHLAKSEDPQGAYEALESQARQFAAWLRFEIEDDAPFWMQFPPCLADPLDLYDSVKALSDDELDRLQTLLTALQFGQVNCDALDTGESLFNSVAQDLRLKMRAHWRPDRDFLNRRTRDQLIEIARECGYADGVGSVASFKKSELVSSLLRHFTLAESADDPTDAQAKARDWLPGVMLFPAVNPDSAETASED